MYTLLYWPGGIAIVLTVIWIAFLRGKTPVWALIVGYVLLGASAAVVFSNDEVTIEQGKYMIAVILAIAGIILPLSVYAYKSNIVK